MTRDTCIPALSERFFASMLAPTEFLPDPVGASTLAMDANDDAGHLYACVA